MTDDLATGFPRGFLFGAATSAYQIEGGGLAGGRVPAIWDTFSHTPGGTRHGDTGDIACEHVHRWPEDLDIVRDLGLTAYRMSLSWARLQPEGRGPLDPAAVAFYRAILGRLRDDGVRPFVTLYHWELPQVVEDAGGWPARDTAFRFADLASAVVAALGDLAEDWITVNEPWCQAFLGYGSGIHAPGRRDLGAAVAAAHHLLLGHGLAVDSIRAAQGAARVGIADIVTDVRPASERPVDLAAAARYDVNSNRLFLDPVLRGGYPAEVHELYDRHGLGRVIEARDEAVIGASIDFLGVNHYQRVIVCDDPMDDHLGAHGTPAAPATTSLGWSVIPEALHAVLLRLHREYPRLPLYITENGASYHDYLDPSGDVHDPERVAYLDGYLGAAARAIAEGVDLRGYFHWSLLDNFEWGEGYGSRFGLVHVEFASQRRTLKDSARWYRDLITRHADANAGASGRDRVDPTAQVQRSSRAGT